MGGVSTTAGQASGGITVVENQVITSPFPMTESPLADEWTITQQQGIPLTAIPKDEVDRIEFGLRIDSAVRHSVCGHQSDAQPAKPDFQHHP